MTRCVSGTLACAASMPLHAYVAQRQLVVTSIIPKCCVPLQAMGLLLHRHRWSSLPLHLQFFTVSLWHIHVLCWHSDHWPCARSSGPTSLFHLAQPCCQCRCLLPSYFIYPDYHGLHRHLLSLLFCTPQPLWRSFLLIPRMLTQFGPSP